MWIWLCMIVVWLHCFVYKLQNMMQAIGRVIRARQEDQIHETMDANIRPFSIIKDPHYLRIWNVGSEATKIASTAGLGWELISNDILIREEESMMFTSVGASLTSGKGINNQFVYLAYRILFVHRKQELRLTYKKKKIWLQKVGDTCLQVGDTYFWYLKKTLTKMSLSWNWKGDWVFELFSF